jgi:hypothetical protein
LFEFDFTKASEAVNKTMTPELQKKIDDLNKKYSIINDNETQAKYTGSMLNLVTDISFKLSLGVLLIYHKELQKYLQSNNL